MLSMLSTVWHLIFFDPIYNCLVFLIDVVPHGDVGIAIILVIIIVKAILFPLSVKAAKTQKLMKQIEPKLKEIKKNISDPQEQAKATMDLYKEAGMNPFSSIIVALLQIPVLIALYFSVSRGGGVAFPAINTAVLYSFVHAPTHVSVLFLGLIDMTKKSLLLSILAVIAQFIQGYFIFPKPPERDPDAKSSMKDDFARSMHIQMRYMMPVMIGIIAYTVSAILGLYFIVSSIAAIVQELLIRKHKV